METEKLTPTDETEGTSARQGRHSICQWLHRRAGLNSLLHAALDEPIPGGARIAYVFGSGLLFLFVSQVITGVFLALYYVPSADHAHTTVAYITKEVTGGGFLRSVHAYGSSAIIIVILLYMTQTFVYGPAGIAVACGMRLVRVDAGNGIYGLSASLGSEGLLRHDRRDKCIK